MARARGGQAGSERKDAIATTYDDPPEVIERMNEKADGKAPTRRGRPKYRTIAF